MTVERPDNTLAVICGAVTKAHLQAVAASDEYKRILDKGEVPDKKLLRTAFTLDFIYENNKYQVLATRSAAGLYTLLCNGGKVSIGLRTLADGGLLVYSMVDLTLFTGVRRWGQFIFMFVFRKCQSPDYS
jgi:acetyl-CoA carboxylase/biotin carboxylase 1